MTILIGLCLFPCVFLFFLPYNIQSLICGIGRFIRQWQQHWVVELGKTHVVPFNIFMDARYQHVKVGSDELSFRTSKTNLGKSIKKFDVLSIEEE